MSVLEMVFKPLRNKKRYEIVPRTLVFDWIKEKSAFMRSFMATENNKIKFLN